MSDNEDFEFCALCERRVWNPCQPDPDGAPNTAPPAFMPAFDITQPIIALSREALLTRAVECAVGRFIGRLRLSRAEVRGYVHYRLEQGVGNGVRYQWHTREPIEMTPEFIEESFDGRPEQHLPADVPDWRDEKQAYDRAISDMVGRAVSGRIKKKPDHRWWLRFLLFDLARRTPIFDVLVDD
ncbi:MAG: hypothetical protein AAGK02_00375 [Pseudomonadota bacterium]